MKKGAIYKCTCICGGGDKVYCGDFKIITLTNKTCKLEEIKKGDFSYIERFYKSNKETNKLNRVINFRSRNNIKDFIKEEFIKHDSNCGLPFIFTLV